METYEPLMKIQIWEILESVSLTVLTPAITTISEGLAL